MISEIQIPENTESSEKLKIALIDDEENILKSLQRVFRKCDFEIMATTSPEELFEFIENNEVALILSDQRMPEMEGTKVLERIKEISPDTFRAMLTGYADKDSAINAINQGSVSRYLTKPWNDDTLKLEVENGIKSYRLKKECDRLQDITIKQNKELQDLNENLEKRVEERTAKVSVLNSELKAGFLSCVKLLAQLSELHSPVVGSHSKRVAAISSEIAKRMNIEREEHFYINAAAMLHDIGKIGISAQIINKPVSILTVKEKEEYENHSVQGELIVKMVPNLQESAKLIRHHHENYNGTGFPEKLSCDNIPLGSRIIAVSDAYDRILYNREMFQTVTPEIALQKVSELSGSILDPDITKILHEIVSTNKIQNPFITILLSDLKSGVILAEDLIDGNGLLLLPKNIPLGDEQIEKVISYDSLNASLEEISVYRESYHPEVNSDKEEIKHEQSSSPS